jgi:hypothetical protein
MEEYEFDEEQNIYDEAIEVLSDDVTFCCILPCIDPEGDESVAVVWQEVAAYIMDDDTEILFVPKENEMFYDDSDRIRATATIIKARQMAEALQKKGYRWPKN